MAIFLTKNSKRFVDVSLSFEPNPISADLATLTNERAINNSLKNLMMFAAGEVVFDAEIGSGVGDYLFENVDDVTAELLQQEIERVIRFSEPRIELVSPLEATDVRGNENYAYTSSRGVDNSAFTSRNDNEIFANRFAPVRVQVRPDQNAFSVQITYKIVGYEQVVSFTHLLEPTR